MKGFLWLLGIVAVITIFFTATGIIGDGCNTVKKEFQPSALLKKYEDFKNLSAAIDKKRADIEMYQSEIASMDNNDKDDKFYIQQRKSELMGIIAMHNELCAKYNANMVKFNYQFTNVGDLPAGTDKPLPREYKPYINNLKK